MTYFEPGGAVVESGAGRAASDPGRLGRGRVSPGSAKLHLSGAGVQAMSMADRDGFIWYDGKMVPWREATTHVLTHTLHYGMGVFEGVRAYETAQGPAIFRLRDH